MTTRPRNVGAVLALSFLALPTLILMLVLYQSIHWIRFYPPFVFTLGVGVFAVSYSWYKKRTWADFTFLFVALCFWSGLVFVGAHPDPDVDYLAEKLEPYLVVMTESQLREIGVERGDSNLEVQGAGSEVFVVGQPGMPGDFFALSRLDFQTCVFEIQSPSALAGTRVRFRLHSSAAADSSNHAIAVSDPIPIPIGTNIEDLVGMKPTLRWTQATLITLPSPNRGGDDPSPIP